MVGRVLGSGLEDLMGFGGGEWFGELCGDGELFGEEVKSRGDRRGECRGAFSVEL